MDRFLLILSSINTFFIILIVLIILYYYIGIVGSNFTKDKLIVLKKKVKYRFWIVLIIFIIILFIVKYHLIVKRVFFILLFSIIFAYLLNPLVNIVEKKSIKRVWAVLVVYLTIFFTLSIIFISIIPKIVEEFKSLMQILPSYINQIYSIFNENYIKYTKNINNLPIELLGIKDAVIENLLKIQNVIVNSTKQFTNSIISGFSKIVTFVLVPILAFYFLKDKELFSKKLCLSIPKEYRRDVIKISREIDFVLGKFIRGQLIVATFVGVATSISLMILRIDFALIIGLIAGLGDIIPYFGPIIGIIPAILFALLDSPGKAIWVIIIFTIIQQIEGNIVSPKIVGESVGIHPVIIIIILLIGGSLFGILGMLLAVPFAAIMKVIVSFIIEKITDNMRHG